MGPGGAYTVGRAIPCRVHACRADSASPGQHLSVSAGAGDEKNLYSFMEERHGKNLNQGRPVPSVRGRTEATRDERFSRAANHRPMWDVDPVMHAYVTSPDLDRLIARGHGDPAWSTRYECCFTNCWLPGRRAKPTNCADRRSLAHLHLCGGKVARRSAPPPRSSRPFETPAEGTR